MINMNSKNDYKNQLGDMLSRNSELKQELLNGLERIADGMDTEDFLNRYAIEGFVSDIKALQWKINTKMD